MWLIAVLVVVLLSLTFSVGDYQTCHRPPSDNSAPFTVWSAYEASGANLHADPEREPGCEPIQLWALIRHGTRQPSAANIPNITEPLFRLHKSIQENWKLNRSKLCKEDYERIRDWASPPDLSQAYEITEAGWREENYLGERWLKRFPSLLKRDKPDSDFKFYYSNTSRTRASAKAFSKGLRGHEQDGGLSQFASFYERCPSFGEIWSGLEEKVKFRNGPEMRTAIQSVSRVLGFTEDLSFNDVFQMRAQCAYERAWNWFGNKSSPWCAPFSQADLTVFEYQDDLAWYGGNGYGWPGTDIGCVAVRNMIDTFKTRIDSDRGPAAKLIFSHDTMVLLMLTSLGLDKDETPLRADNFAQMSTRKWRTSHSVPFNANFVAVLYKCNEGDQHRVRLFLQERSVLLKGCTSTLCPLTRLQYEYHSDTCEITDVCRSGKETYYDNQ